MIHPDILQQLGQLRREQDIAAATRERAIHGAGAGRRPPVTRRLAPALVLAAPIVLWMLWLLTVH